MTFLGLQAIDGQVYPVDASVSLLQAVEVLLPSSEHGLVALEIHRAGIGGQRDTVRVAQLVADKRNGPVSSEATMPDEGEDIPADEPTGEGDGEFSGGAEGMRANCQVVSRIGRRRGLGTITPSTEPWRCFNWAKSIRKNE